MSPLERMLTNFFLLFDFPLETTYLRDLFKRERRLRMNNFDIETNFSLKLPVLTVSSMSQSTKSKWQKSFTNKISDTGSFNGTFV